MSPIKLVGTVLSFRTNSSDGQNYTKSAAPVAWLWPTAGLLKLCRCTDSRAWAEWHLDGQQNYSSVRIFCLTSSFKLIEVMKNSIGHVTEITSRTRKGPQETSPKPNWQFKRRLTQRHRSDGLITGNGEHQNGCGCCCQTHCHCLLVVRMLQL